MSDDFDWSEFKDDKVVSSQRAVIAYLNADRDVVIRQEQAIYSDGDDWVVIPNDYVPKLIEKLKMLIGAN